jgi:hypothetical protein
LKLPPIVIAVSAALAVLSTAYVISLLRQSADLLVAQAVTATFAPARTAAWWALNRLDECPDADVLPSTPFAFAISAWDDSTQNARFERLLTNFKNLGCDIDRRGMGGLTALHSAILFNNPAAATALRQLGADPRVVTAIDGRDGGEPVRLDALAFAQYLDQVSGEDRSAVIAALGTPAAGHEHAAHD